MIGVKNLVRISALLSSHGTTELPEPGHVNIPMYKVYIVRASTSHGKYKVWMVHTDKISKPMPKAKKILSCLIY